MERKNYVLKERSVEILHSVMKKEHLRSETAALEYVLLQYDRQQKMEYRIAEILKEQLGDVLNSVLASMRQVELQSHLTLDGVNTILQERGYTTCYPEHITPSPVMDASRLQWKRKMAQEKQRKDSKMEKGGGIK